MTTEVIHEDNVWHKWTDDYCSDCGNKLSAIIDRTEYCSQTGKPVKIMQKMCLQKRSGGLFDRLFGYDMCSNHYTPGC